MSEEQIPTIPPSAPEMPQLEQSYTPDSSESPSNFWMWLLLIFLAGLFILGGYYYFLYFYDASSMEDAIEKAIKRFNESTSSNGHTGTTGGTGDIERSDEEEEKEVTFKKVLKKALDNAVHDKDDEKEGFSAMDASLGKYSWSLLDDPVGCDQIMDANMCMSGNIFPSRDICINPNIRV